MKLLEGKMALITGASRGIGRAIALRFAQQGADVVFTDLRIDEHSASLEKEIRALGVKGKGYASNAADLEESTNTVNDIIKEFGRIDILVNNAGITRDKLMLRMTEEDWDLVIGVNLKSAFNLTKAVQRYMIKQRGGSIINMSSVVGVSGNAGQANYAASKAGLIGFSKSVAQELGSRNVRCNAIAPGFIETEMTGNLPDEVREEWAQKIPLRRAGKAGDVADVALFLASDISSYVTGQVVNVCGGMNT